MDDNERAIGRSPEGVEIYTPIWNEEKQWWENKYGIPLVGKLEEEQSAFVELDKDDFVCNQKLNVVQEYIDEGWLGDPSKWVQSSCGNWFRHHSAGHMDKYDRENDIFISHCQFRSWTLDENFVWQPPVPWPEETEWDGTFLHYKAGNTPGNEKSRTQDWTWDEGELQMVPYCILISEEYGQENFLADCGSGEYEED